MLSGYGADNEPRSHTALKPICLADNLAARFVRYCRYDKLLGEREMLANWRQLCRHM